MGKTNKTKEEKYKKEREELVEKILGIINVDIENGKDKFILYDIQKSEEKRKNINELAD